MIELGGEIGAVCDVVLRLPEILPTGSILEMLDNI